MKQVIILILLFAFATASFGQQTIQKQPSQVDYLKKSKNQKTAALILLAGGAALVVTAFAIPEGEPTEFDPYCFCTTHKNDGVKGAFVLGGVLSMVGSIPLFIVSGKNKRKAKAASVFINIERARVLQQAVVRNQSFPAVGLKISL